MAEECVTPVACQQNFLPSSVLNVNLTHKSLSLTLQVYPPGGLNSLVNALFCVFCYVESKI